MYATTICDNFFAQPDDILSFAQSLEYYPSETGVYPGVRSSPLHEINPALFNYFAEKLFALLYSNPPDQWMLDAFFQVINPLHEDQYHPKNKGWIHSDVSCNFGGIVYLNKQPDKDTGTSIYKMKHGFSYQNSDNVVVKKSHFMRQQVDDDVYKEAWEENHTQYTKTVSVDAEYNRLLLFNSSTYHGVETFGCTQPRLTLVFFGKGEMGHDCYPPLYR